MSVKEPADNKIDYWVKEYVKIKPKYKAYCKKLQDLLEPLMRQNSINCSITGRVKDEESFVDKIKRKNYTLPLEENTDFVGLRIVPYNLKDIDKICEFLNQEFEIDVERSRDTRLELEPNQLGYLAIQYVVSLINKRAILPEWKDYSEIVAEIQIRTALHDVWATIEHILQYKSEVELPRQSKRRLFRLAGLIEIIDEEFSRLFVDYEKLKEEVARKIEENNLSIPINGLTLEEYVLSSPTVKEILDIAKKTGLEEIFPIYKSYEELAFVCEKSGLSFISDLDDKLKNDIKPQSDNFFKNLIDKYKEPHKTIYASKQMLLTLTILGLNQEEFSKSENISILVQRFELGKRFLKNIFNAGKIFEVMSAFDL